MPRLTITIDDDQSELLDELTQEGGKYESKSAAVRDFIQAGKERHELQNELERKKDRIQTLEEQLERRHDLKNEIQELPDKVRGEPSYSERRQRKLDQASLGQRLKWKVTGVPADPDE